MRFFVTDKESPLMKDDLESVGGPIQRPQKKFEKKNEVENSRKSAHSHTFT